MQNSRTPLFRNTASRPSVARWFWWPLRVFVIYISGTLLLHLFGPVVYPDDANTLDTVCFIIAAMAFFAMGYSGGRSVPAPSSPSRALLGFMQIMFRVGVIAACVLGGLILVEGIRNGVSLESIINPGTRYRETMTAAREYVDGSTSMLGQLLVLLAPLSWLAIPIGLVRIRSLSRTMQIVVLTGFCLPMLSTLLALGTFKRTGDATVLVASTVALMACRRELRMKTLKWGMAVGAVAFLSFFGFHQYSRLEAYDATGIETLGQMQLDRDSFVFKVLGQDAGTGAALALSYMSQGYYPLGLCLQLPFEWTRGLGHSFAAMGYAGQYLGATDVIFDTYPLRLEALSGHSGLQVWHTIFPWLASDLTFPGSLLFMGLLGWFYARVWMEATLYLNPVSIAVFSYLNIMLLFVPCNNQLFQQRESAIAMYGILLLWVCCHKALNNPFAIDFITNASYARRLKQNRPTG
ncbi:MAG: hypothetical protein WCI20_08215 [bacterium]